jgi:hypothetical protein
MQGVTIIFMHIRIGQIHAKPQSNWAVKLDLSKKHKCTHLSTLIGGAIAEKMVGA